MKKYSYRVIILWFLVIAVVSAGGNPARAMKALSNSDLGGVEGSQGINMYFQDIDATLLQIDSLLLDLTPNTSNDVIFLITDDTYATTLPLGDDTGLHALSFCGSATDENKAINVDFLGFKIDVASDNWGDTNLVNQPVTFSMIGYGSTSMYWVWDLCKFVDRTLGYSNDVFGLTLGEIFWAEKYIDPDKTLFMHLLLSPLESYADAVFIDSNEGDWQGATGLTKAQVRSNMGFGGELGLKPGGGTFGFTGFKKSATSAQKATANSVMLAGKIIDRGGSDGAGNFFPYPNWKTQRLGSYYYSNNVDDWNVMGEAVIGVHHTQTYTRSNYIMYTRNGTPSSMGATSQRLIGQSSPTRPIRFEVATAGSNGAGVNFDCDSDGFRDTYLVSYVNGHYSRTVYYPDSARSSMGPSTGTSPVLSTPAYKHWIIGDLRIGELEEKVDLSLTITGAAPGTSGGSMAVNDISLEYNKVVIVGDRTLLQEIASGSEDYLVPDLDYGTDGTSTAVQLSFLGDPVGCKTGTGVRAMQIANPMDGDSGANFGLPMSDPVADRSYPIAYTTSTGLGWR